MKYKIVDDFFEKSKTIKENDNIFDLEEGHSANNPRLKRVKQPHQHTPFFWDILKESKIENILIDLLGKDISLKTSKLNTKAPGGGAAVEWHQDWAFYPHTNDNVLALGLMINDVDLDNGKVLIAFSKSKEITFPEVEKKILSNGQNMSDLQILEI